MTVGIIMGLFVRTLKCQNAKKRDERQLDYQAVLVALMLFSVTLSGQVFGAEQMPHVEHEIGPRFKDGVYSSKDTLVLSLRLPDIQGERIKLTEGRQGAATRHVVFVSERGSAAALIWTKISSELPTDERYLLRLKERYDKVAAASGGNMQLEHKNDGKASYVQYFFKNQEFEEDVYPYGVSWSGGAKLKSIGVSRFRVIDGYLVEFSMILTLEGAEALEVAQRVAKSKLEQFISGFTLGTE